MPFSVLAIAITRDIGADMAARRAGPLQADDDAALHYGHWLDGWFNEGRTADVTELAYARDDAEIDAVLRAHPSLLHDDADQLIAEMIAGELAADAPGMADELRRARLILRRARKGTAGTPGTADPMPPGETRPATAAPDPLRFALALARRRKEERREVSPLDYRDALEEGILAAGREDAGERDDHNGESLPLRAILTIHLARELAGEPRRPGDPDDAINWCRELSGLRESAPRAWGEVDKIEQQAWQRENMFMFLQMMGQERNRISAALEPGAAATMDPEVWAPSILSAAGKEESREPDGIYRAADLLERSLQEAPAGLSARSRRMLEAQLGGTLTRRAERAASASDLDRAIGLLEPIVADTRASDPPLCAAAEVNLGYAYGVRAEWGRTADWARAAEVLEDAVAIRATSATESWTEAAGNLGIICLRRPDGDRAANRARARELFRQCGQALATPGLEWRWAAMQNNIANALVDAPTGDEDENLDLACRAYENALTVWTKEAHPLEWALTTNRLATAEQNRHGADAEKARALREAALNGLDPEHHPIAWARVVLGYGGLLTSLRGGTASDPATRQAMLRQGIDLYERAAAIFQESADRMDLATALHLRGTAARELAALTDDPAWEEVAQRSLQEALEHRGADDDPHGWATTIYAVARQEANSLEGNEPAEQRLVAALDVLRDGGEARWVARVARLLGRVRSTAGAWASAADAFEVALTAIDEVFSAALARSSRENVLANANNVVEDAAFAMAAAGRAAAAADALENGRGRLLADALRLHSDPFESLAAEHPEAYQRYRQDIATLEQAEVAALALAAARQGISSQAHRDAEADVRRAIRTGREALAASTAALRELQGAAPTAEAGDLIVAYLLTTTWGSLSLVVDADGVCPVWAPGFADKDLRDAVRGVNGGPGLADVMETGGTAVDRVLKAVLPPLGELMRPLGEHLEARGAAAVTIVACGGLGLLPLHAAPYQEGTFGDRFAVSYAPSRAVLRTCEARLAHPAGREALAVSNPTGDLRFAACEVGRLLALVPGSELPGPAASRDAVRAAWRQADVVLFACHGRSVFDDPMRSHLLLADGELTLLDLSTDGTAATVPELVIASACQTAVTDVRRLPDEFLGLPAGFLQSGVSTFVGTLWPTGDLPAALMTMRLTELMYPDNGAAGLSPDQALQHARDWLRRLTGADLAAFAAVNPSLSEVAGPLIDLATSNPSLRPYSSPSVWAAHVLIGAGPRPTADTTPGERPDPVDRAYPASGGTPRFAPEPRMVTADVLQARGDIAGARQVLQEVIESGDPKYETSAAHALGHLLSDHGDVAGAAAALRKAITSDAPEVVACAADHLGHLLSAQGDTEGAEAAFRAAVRTRDPDRMPSAALNLGNLLLARGDVDGALSLYREAMQNPRARGAPVAATNLAAVLAAQQDVAGAKAAYRVAIDSEDEDYSPKAAFRLGQLLADQGDEAGAQQAFQKAADSGHAVYAPLGAINVSVTLIKRGDIAAARSALQTMIDSGDPAQAPMAAYRLGDLLAGRGDRTGAAEAFRNAIDSGDAEHAPMAAYRLGDLLTEQGDETGAAEAYRKAMDSGHPNYAPYAAIALAEILTRRNQLTRARSALQTAIDSGNPDYVPTATIRLGRLLLAQQDWEGARSAFQTVVDSGPEELATEARMLLGALPWARRGQRVRTVLGRMLRR